MLTHSLFTELCGRGQPQGESSADYAAVALPLKTAVFIQICAPAKLASCCNCSCVRVNLAAATFCSR